MFLHAIFILSTYKCVPEEPPKLYFLLSQLFQENKINKELVKIKLPSPPTSSQSPQEQGKGEALTAVEIYQENPLQVLVVNQCRVNSRARLMVDGKVTQIRISPK